MQLGAGCHSPVQSRSATAAYVPRSHELPDGVAAVEEAAVRAVDECRSRSRPRRRPRGRASTGARRRSHGERAMVAARRRRAVGARRGRQPRRQLRGRSRSRIQVAPMWRTSWPGSIRTSRSVVEDPADDVGLGRAARDHSVRAGDAEHRRGSASPARHAARRASGAGTSQRPARSDRRRRCPGRPT